MAGNRWILGQAERVQRLAEALPLEVLARVLMIDLAAERCAAQARPPRGKSTAERVRNLESENQILRRMLLVAAAQENLLRILGRRSSQGAADQGDGAPDPVAVNAGGPGREPGTVRDGVNCQTTDDDTRTVVCPSPPSD